jgi:hypothetical protein
MEKNFAKVKKISGEIVNLEFASQQWVDDWHLENASSEFEYIYTDVNSDNPARIDGYYDYEKQTFISPKPYPSWVLDESNVWVAPVAYPDDLDNAYMWDENTINWIIAEGF